MNSVKCRGCGLVNFAAESQCRRCGVPLSYETPPEEMAPRPKHRLAKSAFRVLGLAAFLLFLGYTSLITTSDPASFEQHQLIDRAIDILAKQGFREESFVLRRFVYYRVTDNWWNR